MKEKSDSVCPANSDLLHDAYAANYDEQVTNCGCHITDVLFGLVYEKTSPGQKVLDAGIGSGLSSELFGMCGLQVHGMDFSYEMLRICHNKEIASTLSQHDVLELSWPYPKNEFDLVICCGVMHFLPDLENVFGEVMRVLRSGGWFAFTTRMMEKSGSVTRKFLEQTIDQFEIYSHSTNYIESQMKENYFILKKYQKCFIGEDIFAIWVVMKDSDRKEFFSH